MNQDYSLIEQIKSFMDDVVPKYVVDALQNTAKFTPKEDTTEDERQVLKEQLSKRAESLEHPLDKDVKERLGDIALRSDDDEFRLYYSLDKIKQLWKVVISKSIKCLRYFDTREPFIENESKHPVAYGIQELGEYFDKYTEFESMLYGGGQYYRDHIVHVFRVWLLGLDCLLGNKGAYLDKIIIVSDLNISNLEKLSIWSMIALTHDLGYPLEKSQNIIETTKNMMKSFVADPNVTMDLSFSGIQNNMNDYVIRFISSKMHKIVPTGDNLQIAPKAEVKGDKYVARLQSKYYFKLQKSLEKNKHGVLSAIIIYKLLIYFLESDFSINEDYIFDAEETRQFYIRREILRAISSHTCHDIYHLNMFTFAFLLIMVDDAQEWGRKCISELYVKKNSNYSFDGLTPYFDDAGKNKFILNETFNLLGSEPEIKDNSLKSIFHNLTEQSKAYEEILRDGQDTGKRNFDFEKTCNVVFTADNKKVTITVKFVISNKSKSNFEVSVSTLDPKTLEPYNGDYFKKLLSAKSYNKSKAEDGSPKYIFQLSGE